MKNYEENKKEKGKLENERKARRGDRGGGGFIILEPHMATFSMLVTFPRGWLAASEVDFTLQSSGLTIAHRKRIRT